MAKDLLKKSEKSHPPSPFSFGAFESGFEFFALMASMGIILRNGLDEQSDP